MRRVLCVRCYRAAMRTLPCSALLLFIGCAKEPKERSPDGDDTAVEDDTGSPDAPTAHRWSEHCAPADTAPVVTAAGDGVQVATDHFDLYLEGEPATRAEEYGRLAEALWLALAELHDDAVPTQVPLDVRVYASSGGWQAGMAAAGVTVPASAGGYYDPGTRIASLYQQPTVYYTQTLFIHEALHQVHALARLGGGGRATWYIEGVAEHFSRHDWDGACLRLGVTALLSFEDMPAAAVAQLSDLDVDAALAADAFPGRPSMFGFVRALDLDPDRHDAFTAFRAAYDAGGGDAVALLEEEGLGGLDGSTLAAGIPPEPMSPRYLEWVPETSDSLYGFADVLSFAYLKQSPATFSATMTAGTGLGGVLLGYTGPDEWEVLLLGDDGGVSVFGIEAGEVRWDNVASVSAPSGPVTFTLTPDAVQINAESVDIPRIHPAAAGVALYGAAREFVDLTWSE